MTLPFIRHFAKLASTFRFNPFPSLSRYMVPAGTLQNRNMTTIGESSLSQLKEEAVEEKYDYESAVRKLHTLVSNAEVIALHRAFRNTRRANHIKNINRFLEQSGLEREAIDKMSMIHVSGTKGKGSTCAFCERILHSRGYKTGLFSSPHLVEIRERIRINGKPVSKELYAYHFWKVYNRLKDRHEGEEEKFPAYFAFNMILSVHIFLAEGVDVCIMEVGIGGQYDSTNFIRKPAVCGMTSLGLDHTSLLGNTLEEIAWNKAGIFKMGCPAIVVEQNPGPMKVVLDRAKERQSALYLATLIDEETLKRENIRLGIMGHKQRVNAGLAVQLADMWEMRNREGGMDPVTCNVQEVVHIDDIPALHTTHLDSATAKGLSSCRWPGRAQVVKHPKVTYYLDGAHTRESIQVCAQWFQEVADQEVKAIKGKVARVLVFNVTGERKPEPLLSCLTGCNFEAAGFPTNSVSTLDAFNRIDQINPMYSSKAMVEKTEANKACWDEISQTQRTSGLTVHSPDLTSPSANIGSTKTDGVTEVKVLPDAAGDCGNKDNSVVLTDYVSTVVKSSHFKESSDNNSSVFLNNNKYSPDKNLNSDSNVVSNGSDIPQTGSTSVCCSDSGICVSDDSVHINGFDADTEPRNGDSKTSYTFHSVLQALSWATCGKDPTIIVRDPSARLPPLHPALENADHVQVLVTGSLLLVGAVLDVVIPNMND